MTTETTDRAPGALGSVRRHPIGAFVLLAYALSWWPWIWYLIDPATVDAPILPFGPLLAAIAVLGVLGGWGAIRPLLAKALRWRIGAVWYIVCLLLPFATMFLAVQINVMLGATPTTAPSFPPTGEIAARFVVIFLMIGVGEEIAWRGFLFDRLLGRHVVLKAAVVTGLVHVVWHAPLFGIEYTWSNILPWAVTVMSFSLVIAWIYLRTGKSALPAMIMHAGVNTWAFQMGPFGGSDLVRLWWLWCALWVLAALVVLVVSGGPFWRDNAAG